MLKKIIIGILTITVVSAAGAAVIYNLNNNQNHPEVSADMVTTQNVPVSNPVNLSHEPSPQAEAEGMPGEPFSALAQIRGFDSNGIDVIFETGETAYIELGPEDYLRSQSFELRETDIVTIEGYASEDIYHASKLISAAGDTIVLRNDDGQPMWSGSTTQQQGMGKHNSPSSFTDQVLPEDWISYSGTLTAIKNSRMTIELDDGTSLSFKTGQPRFFRNQGVDFSIGEQIEVVGFYREGNFNAGDVTQLSTGITVMLLDPNGRPLWAGPGNNNGAPVPTASPAD
jgi:hypothetical protein